MRIDAHQHFWKYDPIKDAWIDNTMLAIRRDFMPTDLYPHLREDQIDGCIAVQADQSEQETEFLLNCAAEFDFILGVIGWLDLRNPNINQRLDYFSKFQKLKGLRHIIQAEADDQFMLSDNFQNGINCLKKYNLIFELLIKVNQLPFAIELVKNFPDQKFILDHMAKPLIKAGEIEPWATHIQALAALPNVFCKLSGMVTEDNWNNWQEQSFKKYLDIVFECFGISRLIFGSDWPVCLLASSYNQVISIIENYLKSFTQSEQKSVMGQNAILFYNLR